MFSNFSVIFSPSGNSSVLYDSNFMTRATQICSKVLEKNAKIYWRIYVKKNGENLQIIKSARIDYIESIACNEFNYVFMQENGNWIFIFPIFRFGNDCFVRTMHSASLPCHRDHAFLNWAIYIFKYIFICLNVWKMPEISKCEYKYTIYTLGYPIHVHTGWENNKSAHKLLWPLHSIAGSI